MDARLRLRDDLIRAMALEIAVPLAIDLHILVMVGQ
jgi:hypothetical protein